MAFGGHKTLTHLTLQGNDQNDMLPPLCEVLRNPKCNLKYLRYISLTTAENPQPVNRASTNLDGNAVQIRGGRNPLFWLDTPRQYSCLENPMGGGAWWAAVHAVAKSRTRLSDFTFTFHFHALGMEGTILNRSFFFFSFFHFQVAPNVADEISN